MPVINSGTEKFFYIGTGSGRDTADERLYVESSGITYPNPDYYIERQDFSKVYVFEYVKSGSGYIECEDKTYRVGEGDFYFLHKNHAHRYYPDKKSPYTKIWINVRGSLVDALINAYDMTEGVIVCHTDVLQIFEDIAFLFKNLTASNKTDILNGVAVKLCELIIKVNAENKEESSVPVVQRIKDYIDTDINFAVTLDELEKHFYLNKSYIISLFRREYAQTPKQYMLARKIAAAKSLLSGSSVQIKEITDMLSFSSTQHFSSVFKHFTNMSPQEYRGFTQRK